MNTTEPGTIRTVLVQGRRAGRTKAAEQERKPGLLARMARNAGRVFGATLLAAMPSLGNVLKRKARFGGSICRVTKDGGKTWKPWPGPDYGTGA